MSKVLAHLQSHSNAMLELLEAMVQLESPTHDKRAVDGFSRFLRDQFKVIGADVDVIEEKEYGDHLVARWGMGIRQILILCHMDTVCPLGTIWKRPFRVENSFAYGPGVLDMKGGIVVTLYALKTLRDLDLSTERSVVIVCNSDEEVGSHSSRAIIEAHAKVSDYVLVMEPTKLPDGPLRTSRKGTAHFDIHIIGRAAHAGVDPGEGVSAILELAHQTVRLHDLTDWASGTTVNVGCVKGGTRANVVAEEACAEIDVRFSALSEGEAIVRRILGLQPILAGAQVEVVGGINAPPMVRSPAIAKAYAQARELALEIGLDLKESTSGGASDGNFTAALGIPTLDGLGVVGDGAHAERERVVISSLAERAALLTLLLRHLK